MPELKRKFRLGEILIQEGLLNQDQLNSALQRSKANNTMLGETLVEMGVIKSADLLRIVGRQVGLPSVDLRPALIDPTVVPRIPKEKAQYYGVIPMFYVEDRLTVATSRPLSIFDFDDLERLADCSIQLVLCSGDAVRQAIDKQYVSEVNITNLLDSFEASKIEVNAAEDQQSEQIGEISEDSPIASLVNYILSTAINDKASDIHIEPDGRILRVRYRLDGVLREMMTQKIGLHAAMVSRIKVMAKLDIAERRRPQDGRIQATISARDIDIRVSTLPTTGGEKVVMRILDSKNLVFDLEQLGFRPPAIVKFKRMLDRPHGLLLVTGPTGSGKTTTLYSALQQLRTPEKNIITVEDPVEYQLAMVNQVQVNEAIDLRFSTILRSVLRQDPNVVMIGEIRDTETAEVAVQAALTGHLVLSTLHTNDSVGAITRLVNMKVEPFLIGSAVVGVIAQRLTRKVCQACKAPYEPPEELRQRLNLQPGPRYAKGKGCKQCFNSGYRGRLGLYEIFEVTNGARQLMERGASADDLRQERQRLKETTLYQEGIMAVEAGLTSPEEVLRVAWTPTEECK